MKDLNFTNICPEQRKLLLKALDFDIKKLKCQFCGDKTDYINCGILPPINKKDIAVITCNSPVCISEYLVKMED